MPIIVGIDGSDGGFRHGVKRDERYDKDFTKSFVTRICRNKANAGYWRGPLADGGGLIAAINGAYEYVLGRLEKDPGEPILLTGYSRGAAGVISLAKKLKNKKIDVKAMMLFDCVDRHMFIDADVVPNNVGYVQHVVRHPLSSSRESFDNDGLSYSPPTIYPAAYAFMCTHGGMGGCPWIPKPGQPPSSFIDEGGLDGKTKITFAGDAIVSAQVWTFCQTFLSEHKFI